MLHALKDTFRSTTQTEFRVDYGRRWKAASRVYIILGKPACLVYGRYEHVFMFFLFLTAFGVLFFYEDFILTLSSKNWKLNYSFLHRWPFISDKACSQCWARENTQPMTSAGRHVAGVTRGKNMQLVFCAGKHAIAVSTPSSGNNISPEGRYLPDGEM